MRRKKSDIALEILKVLDREPLTMTHLNQEVNYKYVSTMSITEVFMDHGLIERSLLSAHPSYLYHITDYGRVVLKRGIRLCWTLGLDFNLRKVPKRVDQGEQNG